MFNDTKLTLSSNVDLGHIDFWFAWNIDVSFPSRYKQLKNIITSTWSKNWKCRLARFASFGHLGLIIDRLMVSFKVSQWKFDLSCLSIVPSHSNWSEFKLIAILAGHPGTKHMCHICHYNAHAQRHLRFRELTFPFVYCILRLLEIYSIAFVVLLLICFVCLVHTCLKLVATFSNYTRDNCFALYYYGFSRVIWAYTTI